MTKPLELGPCWWVAPSVMCAPTMLPWQQAITTQIPPFIWHGRSKGISALPLDPQVKSLISGDENDTGPLFCGQRVRRTAIELNRTLLSWEPAHEGNEGTMWAYDERRHLVGQVAFYDRVGGGGPGWIGYLAGERVTGRCRSAEIAIQAVDARWPVGG